MSLQINNDTITASDLTGGNSDLRYFNTSLHPLIPNKTGYKLLGSPQQTYLLKQWANDNFNHELDYTPKITDIINVGDNTSLYSGTTPSAFTFSFNLDSSALSQGTKLLLEHPNLIKVKTENNILYFNFPWKDTKKWYYLPDNILVEDANSISLTSDGSIIKLIVNSHNFTLLDSDLPLITTGVLGYKEDINF